MYANNRHDIFSRTLGKIRNVIRSRSFSSWCLAFVSILLPQLAIAAQSSQSGGFTSPATDLSITFLRNIFGGVGGGLSGPVTTIIGQIFYVFNSGLLIVAGAFLIYTTTKSIIELANANTGQTEGKFTWWQPIRIVLGIGLLVPKTTGYSTLNTLVIWVVLQGVGLANQIWHRAVYYMAEGGVLYNPTAVRFSGDGVPTATNIIDTKLVNSDGSNVMTASDLTRSEICMHTLYNVLKKSKELSKKPGYLPVFREAYVVDKKKGTYLLKFPGNAQDIYKDTSFPPPSYSSDDLKTLRKDNPDGLNGVCGVYTWKEVPGNEQIAKQKEGMDKYRDAKELGLRYMFAGTDYMSNRSINDYPMEFDNATPPNPSFKETVSFPIPFHEKVATDLVGAVAMYQASIYPMRLHASNGYEYKIDERQSEIDANTVKDLTTGGWVNAGSSYFTMAKVVSARNLTLNEKDAASKQYEIFVDKPAPPRCGENTDSEACIRGNIRFREIANIIRIYFPERAYAVDYGKKYITFLHNRLSWKMAVTPNTSWTILGDSSPTSTSIYGLATEYTNVLNAKAAPQGAGADETKSPFYGYAKGKGAASATTGPVSAAAQNVKNIFGVSYTFFFSPLAERLDEIFVRWFDLFIKPPTKTKVGEKDTNIFFPLLKTQQLGDLMIQKFFEFWFGVIQGFANWLAVYVTAIITVPTYLATVFPLGWIVGLLFGGITISFIKEMLKIFFEIPVMFAFPIAGFITSIILINGIMLAYYIPMLPFMLFTFGVISWLIFVIEAMVAAPLVALGMTHPEGQGLLGRAEQAVMMLLAVFVRPSAMVIGLLMSMVLSYVALDVLNAGFGRIMSSAFIYTAKVEVNYGDCEKTQLGKWMNECKAAEDYAKQQAEAQQKNKQTDPIYHVKNIAMILIYTFILMALMKQCFSLIHGLPSYIMEWINVRTREGMEHQLAEGVQAQISQVAEKLAASAAESAKGSYSPQSFEAAGIAVKAPGEAALKVAGAVVSVAGTATAAFE